MPYHHALSLFFSLFLRYIDIRPIYTHRDSLSGGVLWRVRAHARSNQRNHSTSLSRLHCVCVYIGGWRGWEERERRRETVASRARRGKSFSAARGGGGGGGGGGGVEFRRFSICHGLTPNERLLKEFFPYTLVVVAATAAASFTLSRFFSCTLRALSLSLSLSVTFRHFVSISACL